MKRKVVFSLIAILMIVSLAVGIITGYESKTVGSIFSAKERNFNVNLNNANLSLLLYDSTLNDGRTPITELTWDATDTNDYRVLTLQVNVSLGEIEETINPGELSIEVDSLGQIAPMNDERTSFYNSITISADSSSSNPKKYDWSYTYNSTLGKYILKNNYTIEAGSTFESTVQLACRFSPNNVENNKTTELNAILNDTIESINKIKINYTSNEKPFTTVTTISKIPTIEKLPEGYIWLKFYRIFNFQGSNVRYILEEGHWITEIPEDAVVYDVNKNQVTTNEDNYIDISINGTGTNHGTYYIGIPESHLGETITLDTYIHGEYKDSNYVRNKNPNYRKIVEKTDEINLSDYIFVAPSDKEYISKNRVNKTLGYSQIVNNNYGDGNKYTNVAKVYEVDHIYNIQLGDDRGYVTKPDDTLGKLEDDEYLFKDLSINARNYDSYTSITPDKYYYDVFVRRSGNIEYEKYGETKLYTNVTKIEFLENEKIVGWYIEFKNLEETINLEVSTNVLYNINQEIKNTGELWNLSYLRIFDMIDGNLVEREKNRYTQVPSSIQNEVMTEDIEEYNTTLFRAGASTPYKEDYEDYGLSYSNGDNGYDNNFYYKNNYSYPQLLSSSTGTKVFNGFKSYVILPSGTEVNGTIEELKNLISTYSSNTYDISTKAKKQDGTFFTREEYQTFLKNHVSITIDNNFEGDGKTLIEYKFDFSDSPLDISETGGNTAYLASIRTPFKVPYESIYTYGRVYIIDMFFRPLNDIENYSFDKTNTNKDLNRNGEADDFFSADGSQSVNVVPAVSSYQELNKAVKSDYSDSRFSDEMVVVPEGLPYQYKIRIRTGTNAITNLVIYDNIENNDGWKGYFNGVDLSFTQSQGYSPTVYVSNDRTAGKLDEQPEKWRLYDSSADNSQVKSIAFDYGDNVINSGGLTFVIIDMIAPTEMGEKEFALNTCYTTWNAIDLYGNIIDSVEGVEGNQVAVASSSSTETISVEKEWDDSDNLYHVRTENVTVHLKRNGETVETAVLSNNNNWKHDFINIPIYDENYESYEYTVSEEPINLYNTSYEEIEDDDYTKRSFKVKNTLDTSKLLRNFTGRKYWSDNNNKKNIRPTSINLMLLQDGAVYRNLAVSSSNNWTYSFSNVPLYKNNTKLYNYEVVEAPISGYVSTNELPDNEVLTAIKFNENSRTPEGADYVDIIFRDGDREYYTRSYGALGNKTIYVPTNTFDVHFHSDGSIVGWGFEIDEVKKEIPQTGGISYLPYQAQPNITYIETSDISTIKTEHNYSNNTDIYWRYIGEVEEIDENAVLSDFDPEYGKLFHNKLNVYNYTINYLEEGSNTVIKTKKTGPNTALGTVITAESEVVNITGYNFDQREQIYHIP